MKLPHTLLYYLTVLLIETALAVAVILVVASFFSSRSLAPHGVGMAVLRIAKAVAELTLLRVTCGQIPANITLHLLALGRARGYARVAGISVLINAGMFVLVCLVMTVLDPSEDYFPTTRNTKYAILWWSTLAVTALAPILALRFWRRALLPPRQAEGVLT